MPNEIKAYFIKTGALNKALNIKREIKGLIQIEDFLIARKLGILFAFKGSKHINFSAEHVELNEKQLSILQEIITHYFDVDMTHDIHALIINPEKLFVKPSALPSQPKRKSWFSKMKSFLKRKPNVQEIHA